MQIALGLKDTVSELNLEVDWSETELTSLLNQSLNSTNILEFKDPKGNKVFVNSSAILYCRVITPQEKKVGFGIG